MNECRFELDFIPCADCFVKTEEQGTCDDYALCLRCKKKTAEKLNQTLEEFEEDYRKSQLVAIEGHGYRFHKRPMHFNLGNFKETLCNARGGPHPTTAIEKDVTCKKCLKKLRYENSNSTQTTSIV